jgi:hypothetical protein
MQTMPSVNIKTPMIHATAITAAINTFIGKSAKNDVVGLVTVKV